MAIQLPIDRLTVIGVARSALRIVLPCACALSSAAAFGAWTTDGWLRLDSRYDDNVQLSPDNEEDAIVTAANAGANVRRVTENSELSVLAGVSYFDYSGYSGQEDLTNENVEYGDVRGEWRGDRVTWNLASSIRRDVLLETVGIIRDPLAPVAGTGPSAAPGNAGGTTAIPGGTNIDQDVSTGGTVDEGSVEQQVRRYDIGVNPTVDYNLTERTTATLGYGFQRLEYHDAGQADLEDSDTNRVSLAFSHELSEVDSVRLSTNVGRYSPQNNSDTDAWGATVGWAHEFSEVSGASIDVGGNSRDQDGNTEVGLSFRLRGYRQTESGRMYLQATRSLMPSGGGTLAETDQLLFGYRTPLSETVDATLTANVYSTNSNDDASNDDRKYLSVGPQLRWAFTPNYSIGATYRYTWVDRQDDPGSAQGNSIGIFIAYQPQREF
jgi:hypothetical protein